MEKAFEMQPFLSNCAILPWYEAKFLEREERNPAAFIHSNHLLIPHTPWGLGLKRWIGFIHVSIDMVHT